MKVKFVEFKKNELLGCLKCCKDPCDGYQLCTAQRRKDGKNGYFVIARKPRAGKYERLLKALLKCFTVESKLLLISGHLSMLTPKNEQQLIAIKESMEKGAKV